MTRAHAILDTALIMSFIALVFFAPLMRINRRFRRAPSSPPSCWCGGSERGRRNAITSPVCRAVSHTFSSGELDGRTERAGELKWIGS